MLLIVALTFLFLILILIRLYGKPANLVCKSKKNLNGKVIIVTGGSAGMGLEVAKDFARRGAKVYIVCPFEEEGLNGKKQIVEATGNKNVIFKLLDLSSQTSIRQFVTEFLKTEDRLDILVNNAGVGIPINSKIISGTNFIMHVNYFGHFLLTILFLPILKKTGSREDPARIAMVSSMVHRLGKLDHKPKNRTDFLYRFMCYCNSKYCMMLFTHDLSKKLRDDNVVINTVDPGLVGTGIYESWYKFGGTLVKNLLTYAFKNAWEGAQTTLHVALDEEAGNVSGQYFSNCQVSRAKKSAYDDKLAEILWEDSIRIVNLNTDELKRCINDKYDKDGHWPS